MIGWNFLNGYSKSGGDIHDYPKSQGNLSILIDSIEKVNINHRNH